MSGPPSSESPRGPSDSTSSLAQLLQAKRSPGETCSVSWSSHSGSGSGEGEEDEEVEEEEQAKRLAAAAAEVDDGDQSRRELHQFR